MGGFIVDSVGSDQSNKVHNDCVRPIPPGFRGLVKANADGTCPDIVITWTGSDFSDQPRYRSPADVGHLELYDKAGNLIHDFGFITTSWLGTYTIPGSWFEDGDGQAILGAWYLRCRQPTSGELAAHPGADVTATADPLFGREQGMTQFCIVPYSDIVHPPVDEYPNGEIDAGYWGLLGIPQRVGVRLRDPSPSKTPASYHPGNTLAIQQLVTFLKGRDPNRTHPDGLPAELIFCSFPDYLPEHASLVTSIVGMDEYADVDVFVCTNEIRADGQPEGGVLSGSNVALQRSFYNAVKAGRSDALVGSASSVKIGPGGAPGINTYFAAAGANTPGATVGFDILIVHDYPGGSGTPGYQDDYFGTLATINWNGPIASDEACGEAGQEYGGGYPARQARRALWNLRSRAKWGLSPERAAYYAGSQSHPWGTGSGVGQLSIDEAAGRPGSFAVGGRLYVHMLARKGTSQVPESVLTHPDADRNHLVSAVVYRKTTGGAQPPPSSNPGMVDIQTLGDPDATVVLAITGTPGSSLTVWNADGKELSAPVTAGKVTLDRALLGGDGTMDGCYVFLPGGCSATLVDPDAALPRVAGIDLNVSTDAGTGGVTGIANVLRPAGSIKNALVYDVGNTGNSVSPWRFGTLLHDGDTRRITFAHVAGAKRLRRLELIFTPPWQAQSTPTRFNVVGVRGGVETVLAAVDTNPAAKVLDWRSDAAAFSAWHLTFWNDQHVFEIDVPADHANGVVDSWRLDIMDATYGGSPTKNAATGFSRTATWSADPLAPGSGPPKAQDVETWTGLDADTGVTLDENLLGAGFAAPRRPALQRVVVHAQSVGGGGGGGPVPGGTLRYLIRAS